MKKIKDFGSFLTENSNYSKDETVNENIFMDIFNSVQEIPDPFTKMVFWLAGGVGVGAGLGFTGLLASVATKGAIGALKSSKLGQRGVELVNKLQEITNKAKSSEKDPEIATQLASTIDEYNDVISELEDGVAGQEGVVLAKGLVQAQDAAEEV